MHRERRELPKQLLSTKCRHKSGRHQTTIENPRCAPAIFLMANRIQSTLTSAVDCQSSLVATVLQKALEGDAGLEFGGRCDSALVAVPKANGAVGPLDAKEYEIPGSRGDRQLVVFPQSLAQDHLSLRVL